MAVKVQITDKGVGRTAAKLFGRKAASVTVGVFGEKGDKPHKSEDGGPPLTMAEIAELHEFGIGVPERSFIRSYVDSHNAQIMRVFLEQMKAAMVRSIRTGKPITDAEKKKILDRVGLKMVGDIQGRISAGDIQPPLDEKTVARKGSSIPLIDTGQLRSSISHLSEVKDR